MNLNKEEKAAMDVFGQVPISKATGIHYSLANSV